MAWLFAFVCISVTDFCSILACIWLIGKVCKLPGHTKHRLFPRQVLSLAIANIVLVICRVPYGWQHYDLTNLDTVYVFNLYFSFNAVIFSELHMAVGFACQMFRCGRMLRCLRHSFFSLWIFSGIVAAAELSVTTSSSTSWQWIEVSVAAICFAVSIVVFALVLCRARRCGDSVLQRNWRRASAYVLNFVVTLAPIVFWSYLEGDDTVMSPLRLLANICLHANGLVNGFTYYQQSRYSRGKFLQREHTDPLASFEVQFGGVSQRDLSVSYDPSAGSIAHQSSRGSCLEDRRVDPLLDGRAVSYEEMCEEHQHRSLGLTEDQTRKHWGTLKQASTLALAAHPAGSSMVSSSQEV